MWCGANDLKGFSFFSEWDFLFFFPSKFNWRLIVEKAWDQLLAPWFWLTLCAVGVWCRHLVPAFGEQALEGCPTVWYFFIKLSWSDFILRRGFPLEQMQTAAAGYKFCQHTCFSLYKCYITLLWTGTSVRAKRKSVQRELWFYIKEDSPDRTLKLQEMAIVMRTIFSQELG